MTLKTNFFRDRKWLLIALIYTLPRSLMYSYSRNSGLCGWGALGLKMLIYPTTPIRTAPTQELYLQGWMLPPCCIGWVVEKRRNPFERVTLERFNFEIGLDSAILTYFVGQHEKLIEIILLINSLEKTEIN